MDFQWGESLDIHSNLPFWENHVRDKGQNTHNPVIREIVQVNKKAKGKKTKKKQARICEALIRVQAQNTRSVTHNTDREQAEVMARKHKAD